MITRSKTLAEEIAKVAEKTPHGYKVSLTDLDWLIGFFMEDQDYKVFTKTMWVALDGPEEWERQMGEGA
jgi:hypothetical protein|tara:strand:+ start:5803 stop:6009 length:207 start_codon:yes stop_codon:yes gene_type:complete